MQDHALFSGRQWKKEIESVQDNELVERAIPFAAERGRGGAVQLLLRLSGSCQTDPPVKNNYQLWTRDKNTQIKVLEGEQKQAENGVETIFIKTDTG